MKKSSINNTNSSLSESPIGIFDSGVGGLTVVKEIMKILPFEAIVYFGDTARVPYGTKSKETITRFATEDATFLLDFGVKAIVVACNTASSNSLQYLKENFNIPIIGVIDPVVVYACKKTRNKKIGVIGTTATIESGAYEKRIKEILTGAAVYSKDCPLFVPLAEEGWTDRQATLLIAQEYLKDLLDKGIDTLVLGCTHYPILKDVIQKIIDTHVHLIDSAYSTAIALKELLEKMNLLQKTASTAEPRFFLSDIPRKFSDIAERFLGEKIVKITVVDVTKKYENSSKKTKKTTVC